MPSQLKRQQQEYAISAAAGTETLRAEERVGLMEECAELLHVFASLTRLACDNEKLSAAVTLDFIFKNGEGKLTACRRTVTMSGGSEGQERRVRGTAYGGYKAGREYVECAVTAEILCAACERQSVSAVSGVVLSEEGAYVQGSLLT